MDYKLIVTEQNFTNLSIDEVKRKTEELASIGVRFNIIQSNDTVKTKKYQEQEEKLRNSLTKKMVKARRTLNKLYSEAIDKAWDEYKQGKDAIDAEILIEDK